MRHIFITRAPLFNINAHICIFLFSSLFNFLFSINIITPLYLVLIFCNTLLYTLFCLFLILLALDYHFYIAYCNLWFPYWIWRICRFTMLCETLTFIVTIAVWCNSFIWFILSSNIFFDFIFSFFFIFVCIRNACSFPIHDLKVKQSFKSSASRCFQLLNMYIDIKSFKLKTINKIKSENEMSV